ncbi:MAG: hypothetical protein ACLFRU_02860 [Paracoccaceae bacterium]
MRLVLILVLALPALSACGRGGDDQVTFDGNIYRAELARIEGDRREFAIDVRPASLGLEGAREAGRYEATKYCIRNFGSSAATWTIGPDSPEEALVVEDDRLRLRGACAG